jgi:hypothetical protein
MPLVSNVNSSQCGVDTANPLSNFFSVSRKPFGNVIDGVFQNHCGEASFFTKCVERVLPRNVMVTNWRICKSD